MADTATAPATIEINDALFCTHFKEVCADCSFDGREENDAFFGFDPIDREGIEAPAAIINKEGVYQCKKHALASTSLLTCLPSIPFPFPPRHIPFVLRIKRDTDLLLQAATSVTAGRSRSRARAPPRRRRARSSRHEARGDERKKRLGT
ncbi:hypothetical protein FB451DRAFT_1280280 [Mycena latifolia]|nr:hypothetical protein FB451DRAFT_1280280 [Mycena latifolia]